MKQFSFILLMKIIYFPVLFGQTEEPQIKYPSVELGYTNMQSNDWIGSRFKDIFPASDIKKIVRIKERGFEKHNNSDLDYRKLEQEDYDTLIRHLIDSEEKAQNLSWLAEEGILAELILLTNDDQLYHLEILGIFDKVSSLTIYGSGRGARFEIKGFKYPVNKK